VSQEGFRPVSGYGLTLLQNLIRRQSHLCESSAQADETCRGELGALDRYSPMDSKLSERGKAASGKGRTTAIAAVMGRCTTVVREIPRNPTGR
jgi:hypothetical protein